MKKPLYFAFPLALACLGLAACNPDFDSFGTPEPKDEENVETITFEFNIPNHGWDVGFADFDDENEDAFDLSSDFVESLPIPLGDESGLRVSGNNVNADLFMFITRRFTGFEPNTRYELDLELTFATNAPRDCEEDGGAPGEDVTIKAGATVFEPLAEDRGDGFLEMNLDKGTQNSTGGSQAIVLGNFANDKSCGDPDAEEYELKTLTSGNSPFIVETDSEGELWFMFGTDSGFEGTTTIYYISGEVVATEST